VAWLVMAPLAGALTSFLLPRLAVQAGLLTGAAVVACAAGLVGQVLRAGPFAHAVGGWGAPLGIELRADGLSAYLVALSALLGAAVSVHAAGYGTDRGHAPGGGETHERRYFWPLWMFLWAGLNALFLSRDVFNLYVTLELLGFAAVALVALANTPEALTAAMRYLLASLFGSLCFLLAVALLYGAYATVDLTRLGALARSDAPTRVALTLMTVGLLVKGALFPFHFWLPPAHASAAAPVSALLSALVVKAPFYILVRLWLEAFAAVKTAPASFLLGLLGASALLWGGAQALRQTRLKMLVAYSTVAQLGYLFLVFPLAGDAAGGSTAWSGALFFVAAHAAAKAAMFLASGNVLHALGHDDVRRMAGLARALPKSVFALGLAGVSLMGLPPSGGFVAKWLLLSAAVERGEWWWVAAILCGTALAIGYVARPIGRALAAPATAASLAPVPALAEWTALALALLAALLGLGAPAILQLLGSGAPAAEALATGGGA
jgi:formate hydrogenlyase subunit 3/multisubunit Na+/H+ antiporter MnhD subunit